MTSKLMFLATAGAIAAFAIATPVEAQRGRDRVVKACSTYGNGCTSAPVRLTRSGYEFRMPGGTWISCRADCKNAIREDKLDFWETQREQQPDGR